jgi:uncharacterized membrane protein
MSFRIAGGAFYLFLVNALAIALVAFFLFKRMHFKETVEEKDSHQSLSVAITALLILAFVAPLSFTFYGLWQESASQRKIQSLVRGLKDELDIVNWQMDRGKKPKLVLYTFKDGSPQLKEQIKVRLNQIYPDAVLSIRHGSESEETRSIIEKVKASPVFGAMSDLTELQKLVRPVEETTNMVKYGSIRQELVALLGSNIDPYFFPSSAGGEPQSLILLVSFVPTSKRFRQETEKNLLAWVRVRSSELPPLRIFWEFRKNKR